MLWGKKRGYERFNLGTAPLSGMETTTWPPCGTASAITCFTTAQHFYNFQGLRQYKEKSGPGWHPKYLVCPGGLALPKSLMNLATLVSGGVPKIFTN